MGNHSGIDRDLLIGAESSWGTGGTPVRVPYADDSINISAERTYYQPKAPSQGPDTDNIPLGIAPKGPITVFLDALTGADTLAMGIYRGAQPDGYPMKSYQIVDSNLAGSRLWRGMMARDMTLNCDRKSGAVTVSLTMEGKVEEAGPTWAAKTYAWDTIVTAKDVAITLDGTEWLWETASLRVGNNLIIGPPFGTAGYPTKIMAGSGRIVTFTSQLWTDSGATFPADLRAGDEAEVIITISPSTATPIVLTMPRLMQVNLVRTGSDTAAQRDALNMLSRKGTAGNIVQT